MSAVCRRAKRADNIPAFRKRQGNRRKRIQRGNIAWRLLLGLWDLPPIRLVFLRVLRIGLRMLDMSLGTGTRSGQRGHTKEDDDAEYREDSAASR